VLLFSSGFSILQLLLSRFVFDTPAWLQSKGRIDDYKTASERLWGPEKSIAREDENDVEEALLGRNLDNGVPVQTEPLSILQLLRSADLRKSVSIVTLGMFAQQASG
jgi:SP family facilitated glucose transporter-like MFS transporter 3